MTTVDDLTQYPQAQRLQARAVLRERADVAARTPGAETAMDDYRRIIRRTRIWAVVGIILAFVGVLSSMFNVLPDRIGFAVSAIAFTIGVIAVITQQYIDYTYGPRLRDAAVLGSYDSLLEDLRDGHDLTDDTIRASHVAALSMIGQPPSKQRVLSFSIFLGVCLVIMLVIVLPTLFGI